MKQNSMTKYEIIAAQDTVCAIKQSTRFMGGLLLWNTSVNELNDCSNALHALYLTYDPFSEKNFNIN